MGSISGSNVILNSNNSHHQMDSRHFSNILNCAMSETCETELEFMSSFGIDQIILCFVYLLFKNEGLNVRFCSFLPIYNDKILSYESISSKISQNIDTASSHINYSTSSNLNQTAK